MTTNDVFSPDGAYRRTYFFVGGEYMADDDESKFGGSIMKGQTYVERLVPVEGVRRRFPLILVHGGGQSGLNWLHTPDDRPGWASYFLSRGFAVYIVDTPSRGRSAPDLAQHHTTYSTGFVEQWFTATASMASSTWPQAKLHTQWPGTGRRGDPIFDAFYASTYPSITDLCAYQEAQKGAIVALLKRIGRPSILLTHSQGAPGGWLAIVAVEPNGPPFTGTHPHNGAPARGWALTDVPITYDPPVSGVEELRLVTVASSEVGRDDVVLQSEEGGGVRKLRNLQHVPVLVEVGEASYHAPYDHATVAYLRQAGVQCDFIRLEDLGIRGNGHMQMLELNNLDIARVLDDWIRHKVEGDS
ncbi:uncharacterized protein Z520_04138 [Fonsecaea multimorphosa CBS 102226]|uniref:Uncharacterized protein n=1 Tax=Fonsecaea multimorphosa CBS 102226 TaxID=1442371 RepID=A0A0D2K3S5_9EURO|nr:uncharacterized protein Z520_04138 [Fonsecaea multimorphosa CBS 102226]KIY00453.1 hypothetical protein Z520_04138 [Fonsecaea multimorphosa CBS 102226]OAL26967.1 hypothetical protein AYO22_03911 [Fonsecaea multimorphosa]